MSLLWPCPPGAAAARRPAGDSAPAASRRPAGLAAAAGKDKRHGVTLAHPTVGRVAALPPGARAEAGGKRARPRFYEDNPYPEFTVDDPEDVEGPGDGDAPEGPPSAGAPPKAHSKKDRAKYALQWKEKKVLGIDYGKRNTGVAVSMGGMAPRPVGVLDGGERAALVDGIMEIAEEEKADAIVVGLPLQPKQKGVWDRKNDSDVAKRIRSFATDLARAAVPLGVPVRLSDEAHTSQEAAMYMSMSQNRIIQRDELVDAAAAAQMLKRFFESPGASAPWGPQPPDGSAAKWPEPELTGEEMKEMVRAERKKRQMLKMMEMRHGEQGKE